MHWSLPVDGARTLSGLVIDHLESIPQSKVGCRIGGYPMEVVEIDGNTVSLVCVWPELMIENTITEE